MAIIQVGGAGGAPTDNFIHSHAVVEPCARVVAGAVVTERRYAAILHRRRQHCARNRPYRGVQ